MFYADANAGVPSSERHLTQVFRKLKESDGNPSSMHKCGRKARVAIETSRREICSYLQIDSEKFIFTSGGTESNNLVLHAFASPNPSVSGVATLPHILISAGDHPSVRNTAKILAEQGYCTLDIIPINQAGILQTAELANLVRSNTVLACLTHANSETGIINSIEGVARAIKELNPKTHVHCDAVQALGKIELNYARSQLDSVAFSAHKLGALKGCGGLYFKDNLPVAQIYGGSQEFNLRAGTENLAGIISFGCIVATLPDQLKQWQQQVASLKNALLEELFSMDALLFAGDSPCLPNTVYFHLPDVSVEDLILQLDLAGIAVSSGSACSSGINRPSTTLTQMGYEPKVASNALRVSFCNQGTVADIKRLAAVLKQT